jgi:hypothetical protein
MSIQSQTNEPEEDLAGRLQDLEQHISQRISRLGEPEMQLVTAELLDETTPLPAIPGVGGEYVPPFQGLEDFDYEGRDPRERNYGSMYRPPAQANYDGIGEITRAVHDLSDLLTESVLNLNIRLATIEEKLALVSQSHAHDLHKGVQEIKKAVHGKAKASIADQSIAGDVGSASEMVRELQAHVKLLEEYINRSAVDVKARIDERSNGLREHLDVRAKVLEKKSNDNKDYLNRHFFSLAILFIIIIFISSALITSSIDRLSGYLTEQSDSIRMQIDQVVFPHHKTEAK